MDGCPVPVDEVVAAELDDELALLLPDNGETLLLNRSAAEVWALCDGRRTVADIAGTLQQQFPDASELGPQVEATVADLLRRGFLSSRSTPLDDRDMSDPSPPS